MASTQRVTSSLPPATISLGTRHTQSVTFITVAATSMRTTQRDSIVSILLTAPQPTMYTTTQGTTAGLSMKTRWTGCLITHMPPSGCRGRLLRLSVLPRTFTRPWWQSTCVAGTSGPLGRRSRGTAPRPALTWTGALRDAWALPGCGYPVHQAVAHLPTLQVRILRSPCSLPTPKLQPLKNQETQGQQCGCHRWTQNQNCQLKKGSLRLSKEHGPHGSDEASCRLKSKKIY